MSLFYFFKAELHYTKPNFLNFDGIEWEKENFELMIELTDLDLDDFVITWENTKPWAGVHCSLLLAFRGPCLFKFWRKWRFWMFIFEVLLVRLWIRHLGLADSALELNGFGSRILLSRQGVALLLLHLRLFFLSFGLALDLLLSTGHLESSHNHKCGWNCWLI